MQIEQAAAPDLAPADLKGLDIADCERLAARIRDLLIDTVPLTGGHLGANLGVVELTVALHRAFDSPRTPIVFDTGHQSYPHKILTGRAALLPSLRQRGGLSGFPSRAESEHDVMENSHASSGAAWALGLALGRGTRVVLVLGDGALTGGPAYEALHAIGVRGAPVTVVYNDNGRSYAPTASRLTLGEDGPARPASAAEGFFRSLGLSYLGPVDGHSIADLDHVLAEAARLDGPVLVHVRTQKGHGWPPAREDAVKRMHDVPAFELGRVDAGPSWSSTLGGLLTEFARRDERIHVITAAMPDTLGLLGFRAAFPERFHDVGICEQLAVGLAAGLAASGLRPVFPVVATFLTRAIDQILYDVAMHGLPVVFVLDRAGITGPDGPSHHGVFDVALLSAVPGLEIHTPSTGAQLASQLGAALARDDGPSAIRYPKGSPRRPAGAPAPSRPGGPAAPASLLRRGAGLCLLVHGATVGIGLEAAAILRREHRLEPTVWEINRLRPVDRSVLADAAAHDAVLLAEDLAEGSGVARELYGYLARSGRARPRVEQVAPPAHFPPFGSRAQLLAEYGLTAQALAERALALSRRVSRGG